MYCDYSKIILFEDPSEIDIETPKLYWQYNNKLGKQQ